MEQFFDLLIGLIIIYSILSPFFKKKNPEEEENNVPPFGKDKPMKKRQRVEQPANTRYADYKEKDILNEIEQLFGQAAKQPAPPSEPVIVKDKVPQTESVVFKEEIRDREKIEAHQENVPSVFSKKKKSVKFTETAIPAPVVEPAVIPHISLQKENVKAIRFRKLLVSRNSIQDALLLSEILGKPKALRR